MIVLSDGSAYQVGSKTAILVDSFPVSVDAVRPGMTVMLSPINPVVSRDGRSVTLNQGFDDFGGSALPWDSVYEGYEATTHNAGMQIPAP